MKKLTVYLAEQGFVSAQLVSGPNGKFVSAIKADGTKATLPVGKRSQNGTLASFNVLITAEGQAIATINDYKTVESVSLVAEAVKEKA